MASDDAFLPGKERGGGRSLVVVIIGFGISFHFAFFYKLGYVRQLPVCKGVFSWEFIPVIPSAIVGWRVVSYSITWTSFVIEFLIVLKYFPDLLQRTALVEPEVQIQLLLDPSVQSLADWVVCRFAGSRHGTDDHRLLDKLVIGHRTVHATLISVQVYRVLLSLKVFLDFLQTIEVLILSPLLSPQRWASISLVKTSK